VNETLLEANNSIRTLPSVATAFPFAGFLAVATMLFARAETDNQIVKPGRPLSEVRGKASGLSFAGSIETIPV
jgi:hypothetical protein